MTRHPRLSGAVLALTALAAMLPVSSATSAPPPAASRGEAVPRAVSLVGTELRLEDDARVELPATAGRWPVLLGTAARGWVVASDYTFRLVRPDGRVRVIGKRNNSELYVTELLSDDGRRVISASTDQGDEFRIKIFDLQGRVVLNTFYSYIRGTVMDAGDGVVYVGGRGGLRTIAESTGAVTRLLRIPVGMVDLGHDTVFVGSVKHPWKVGPTSLSTPGKPDWRARFEPVALSADGEYVVGREGTVRAMADGKVVRRVPAPARRSDEAYRFLGWGAGHEVLIQTTAGKQEVLTSCPVPRGACRRVGTTTGRVSLPTSSSGPFLQP
ncbi:hypothetical protein [Nocardioides houyundeii]|uniref:hypothetical protein n=1 Tax=Nocardioides houyundeii TaxID=2045452 RepID=UPI0013151428|nr:hypothetical protein [Nocardioides houyundeii]